MHVPVMPDEVLEYLGVRPDGVYVDATAGLGGHSARIAARLKEGKLFVCDRDAESLGRAREATSRWGDRITFLHTSFSGLRKALAGAGAPKAGGLLADLGVSLYQLTTPDRGFSLSADGPLDMRMDQSQELTAAHLVNSMAEKALADLIYRYGGERRARQIATALVRARPIRSTGHLARVVESVVARTGRIHPATQTFQALRMEVNSEPEELERLLLDGPELLERGGRFVVLTFMSFDDRMVKQAFQRLAREGRAKILTKHVIKPGIAEVEQNAAARSAKLRAIEMN